MPVTDGIPPKLAVAGLMTRNVVVVPPTALFKDMVELLERHHIAALPVIGNDGTLLGIVSETDLLVKEESRLHEAGLGWLVGRHSRAERRKAKGTTARDLMTAPAVTVASDAPPAVAARTMHRRRVKHLPVVNEHGQVVGIVSRGDVLKVFTRSDDELRHDITEGIIRQWMWLDATSVHVDVDKGVVSLRGRMERRSHVDALGLLAGSVEGVVDVKNQLAYELDDYQPVGGGLGTR